MVKTYKVIINSHQDLYKYKIKKTLIAYLNLFLVVYFVLFCFPE